MYEQRRARVLEAMGPHAVAVFPTAPFRYRNADVEQEYRADSNVLYLSGFAEPGAVLVLSTVDPEQAFVLFVRPKDPERERWDGPRAGITGAMQRFGCNAAHSVQNLDEELPNLLKGAETLYYGLGVDRVFDEKILGFRDRVRTQARRGERWPHRIIEPSTLVHEQRWKKDSEELFLMKKAVSITAEAFARALRELHEGTTEAHLEGILRGTFRSLGAERCAYPPIVAGGENACYLHYTSARKTLHDGELVLIDAGAEFGGYAADITRTVPVNGTLSPAQKQVYQLVLRAQQEAIALVRPGATLEELHLRVVQVLSQGLLDWGILQGSLEEIVQQQTYRPFYMHGTSHWIGLDVHDTGAYYDHEGKARPLQPGCVFTIEPGLYFPDPDPRVPPELVGLGVRIEDDIALTETGIENLSAMIPKLAV